METDNNIYEAAARNQKAALLAGFFAAGYAKLGSLSHAPAAVATVSDERWDEAARLLGIHAPSDATREAAKVYLSQIVAAHAEQ